MSFTVSMLFFCGVQLLFFTLAIQFVSPDETLTESVLSTLPKMLHENTYLEMRDKVLPSIRRTSRAMQSMIIKITEQYRQMQDYKNVINQSCLSSSVVAHMTKLSRNLTRITQEDVPSIEEELQRITPKMEELKEEVDELTDHVRSQPTPQFNLEQLQRSQTLTDRYKRLNNQLKQVNQQLMRIMDEIIRPGVDSVQKYNACLNSTAQSLVDYSVDQIVEHMIANDDDRLFASSKHSFVSNNRTDL